ncbi:MAG: hypothetical protein V4608_03125 [Bacteroidota bacterium]
MKLCSLNYLKSISPNNPKFVKDMILIFINNVPVSVKAMNDSLITSNWKELQHHAHKIRSHMDCVEIPKEYVNIAKEIEESAKQQQNLDLIAGLLLTLESVFQQAYQELDEELEKNYP